MWILRLHVLFIDTAEGETDRDSRRKEATTFLFLSFFFTGFLPGRSPNVKNVEGARSSTTLVQL